VNQREARRRTDAQRWSSTLAIGRSAGAACWSGAPTRRAPARARKTSSYCDEWVRAQSGHWKYRTGLPTDDQLVIVIWQWVHSTESIEVGDITRWLAVNKPTGIIRVSAAARRRTSC
jgi:hypothetical protein